MATNEKQLRIQKEYEESLKVSQTLLGDLGKLLHINSGKAEKGSGALSKQNKEIKSILSGIESQEDLLEGIIKLQDQRNTVDKRYFGINKKLRTGKKAELDIQIKSLTAENQKLNAINQVDGAAQQLRDSLTSSLDGLQDGLSNIPIVGGLLSSLASGPIEGLKSSISDASQLFVTSFAANVRNGMGPLAALKSATASLKPLLAGLFNPVTLGIVALVALLSLAFKGFSQLDSAAKSFRQETGLLNSQTEQLASNIREVTISTAALGVSAEDVAKAASSFTNVFEGVVQPSKEVLENIVALEANFGVAADGAAKVNLLFQSIGGLSERASQALVQQTAEAAKLVGVSPDRVIKDLADNAETAALFFQGSVGSLSKAAVEAARLGTSLTQAASVANNLLDFENSINAELEASAMLGQSINFNKARELAATGDIVGAQQAVLDNLSQNVDLNRLNTFQLQSIAKASGMEVGELQKQLAIRKKFGPLSAEQASAMAALASAGNDVKDITMDQLNSETARLKAQQEFQSQIDQVKNQFGALGTEISMALTPLIKLTIPVLKGIVGLFKLILMPVTFLANQMSKVVDFMKEFSDYLAAAAVGFTTVVGLQNISLIKTKAMAGLQLLNNVRLAAGTKIMGLINTIKSGNLMKEIGLMAMRAFSAMGGIPVVGPVLGAAAAAAAFALGKSYFSKADDMFSPGGGSSGYGNRMITSAAGTLSLNNQDDVIAGTNLMGGGGGGMDTSPIVNAIEKLGSEIAQLKFQVNMDGAKVAEGISKVNSRSNSNSFGAAV